MCINDTAILGFAELGASTFVASAHPSESCGSNGLPLTPNSVRILGRSQQLYCMAHPHLCCYVDVHRGKHERIVVIQEYHNLNLLDAWEKYDSFKTEKKLLEVAHQVLQGLVYLSNMDIGCCGNLCPTNILIDPFGQAKIHSYGLFYMTEMGTAVSFPIGSSRYSAPEVLVSCARGTADHNDSLSGSASNATVDSWSLGCILMQLLMLTDASERGAGTVAVDVRTVLKHVMENKYNDLVSALLADHPHLQQRYKSLSPSTSELLRLCLQLSPESRATPSELLEHPAFTDLPLSAPLAAPLPCFPRYSLQQPRPEHPPADQMLLDYPLPSDLLHEKNNSGRVRLRGLRERCIREVYHLWQLAGGQAEQELARHNFIRTHPPILTLPSVAVVEGELLGGQFYRLQQQQPSQATLALSLRALSSHLAHLPLSKYYPLITQRESGVGEAEARKLPLVIRERDVEYQFHRIVLFHRLLKAYPYQRDRIISEARQDIAPYWRGHVWAALLAVDGDVQDTYTQIDKVTPTSTDRQIEVDIPRCHQYDELLSSPRAHVKFTRLLKAWVVAHPGLVYWQGLDSLTAPFLYLNFNDEALAYACLSAFIDKYLHKFFLRDNSAVIQEYLAKFSHLIAFHDPLLHTHLATIGFVPELYAIPWFLTMYTHVFPLSQIFHVWDTLLLYPASLALCVATAILRHLRHQLLTYSFNDCILLFSDMPDINIEQIVSESVQLFEQTPTSLTYRHHAPPDREEAVTANTGALLEPALLALSDLSDMSLLEVRSEVCGRISAADVLTLAASHHGQGHAPPLIIDTRPQHVYQSGSLVNAWNLPAESWLSGGGGSPGGDEPRQPSVREVQERARGGVVVVMGAKAAHHVTMQVCEQLVSGGVLRVCSLHGGVDALQAAGQLVVPSPGQN